mgnify:FL=1
MKADNEIIREVREVRHRIALSCGNDIRKIIDYANAVYEQFVARSHKMSGAANA